MTNRIFFIALFFLLTSCSVFSPVKLQDESAYQLTSTPAVSVNKSAKHGTLQVAMPDASPVYDTTDMAYTLGRFQISYFSKNHWAASPTSMLQNLMIQTLQNTHRFRAVTATAYVGRSDYILNSELLQLEQDFTHNPSLMRVKLRVQLVRSSTNQIIASKEFYEVEPAFQNTPYSGVVAANKATSRILADLTRFCLKSI